MVHIWHALLLVEKDSIVSYIFVSNFSVAHHHLHVNSFSLHRVVHSMHYSYKMPVYDTPVVFYRNKRKTTTILKS